MRQAFLCILLIGLASRLAAGEQEDRKAIARLLSSADLNRTAVPDLDWENAFGVRQIGAKARQEFLNEVVVPTTRSAEYTLLETRIRFIGPDVAVADEYAILRGQTDAPRGSVLPDRHIRTTYIFQRVNGRWRLALERIADLRS